MKIDGARWLLRAVILSTFLAVIAIVNYEARAQVPAAGQAFQRTYVRIAGATWGTLNPPLAALAAQIHQESGWNCQAVSKVGARGCAQFMPATAKWISDFSPSLASGLVNDPAWAFEAQVRYMRWLYDRVKGPDACNRLGAALASYNQGLGWTLKAQKKAGTDRWFDGAELANPGQAAWAITESRAYPRRILFTLEPRYAAWGTRSCV